MPSEDRERSLRCLPRRGAQLHPSVRSDGVRPEKLERGHAREVAPHDPAVGDLSPEPALVGCDGHERKRGRRASSRPTPRQGVHHPRKPAGNLVLFGHDVRDVHGKRGEAGVLVRSAGWGSADGQKSGQSQRNKVRHEL